MSVFRFHQTPPFTPPAALFLEVNGLTLAVTEEEVVLLTLALAAGEISEADYTARLSRSC